MDPMGYVIQYESLMGILIPILIPTFQNPPNSPWKLAVLKKRPFRSQTPTTTSQSVNASKSTTAGCMCSFQVGALLPIKKLSLLIWKHLMIRSTNLQKQVTFLGGLLQTSTSFSHSWPFDLPFREGHFKLPQKGHFKRKNLVTVPPICCWAPSKEFPSQSIPGMFYNTRMWISRPGKLGSMYRHIGYKLLINDRSHGSYMHACFGTNVWILMGFLNGKVEG